MKSLEINTSLSSELHYRKYGNGPAVMLLHGFPENGGLWESTGEKLSQDFTVLIPDIPGAGASELNEEYPSLEEIATSLKIILDHEKIDKLVLTGHSMGGYISLAFAEKYPSRLAGLSLVHSTATADSEEKKETRRKAIELIRKGGKRPFIQQAVSPLFAASFRAAHPDVINNQVERGLKLKDESIIAFYTAMINRPDRTATLELSDIPVQWIIGREDNVVPLTSALQQCKLANVNFVSLYPLCGHMSMIENPDELLSDLRMFYNYCYKE